MDDPAQVKLERIREFVREINRLKPDTPEQDDFISQVRALADEYQKIVDARNKPNKPK